MVYTVIKDFEWDDPFQLRAEDAKHSSPSEKREWLIGAADIGVVVVVFTIRRPRDICRIISARKAKRRERRQYEQLKRIPL